MLECLKFVKGGNIAARAEIPGNCEINRNYNFQRASSTMSKQYNAWMLNYHFLKQILVVFHPLVLPKVC